MQQQSPSVIIIKLCRRSKPTHKNNGKQNRQNQQTKTIKKKKTRLCWNSFVNGVGIYWTHTYRCANFWPHTGQEYGFAPDCFDRKKRLFQRVNKREREIAKTCKMKIIRIAYVFVLTWTRKCRVKCDDDRNIWPHSEHFSFLMSSWAIMCILKEDLWTNSLPHRSHW